MPNCIGVPSGWKATGTHTHTQTRVHAFRDNGHTTATTMHARTHAVLKISMHAQVQPARRRGVLWTILHGTVVMLLAWSMAKQVKPLANNIREQIENQTNIGWPNPLSVWLTHILVFSIRKPDILIYVGSILYMTIYLWYHRHRPNVTYTIEPIIPQCWDTKELLGLHDLFAIHYNIITFTACVKKKDTQKTTNKYASVFVGNRLFKEQTKKERVFNTNPKQYFMDSDI